MILNPPPADDKEIAAGMVDGAVESKTNAAFCGSKKARSLSDSDFESGLLA